MAAALRRPGLRIIPVLIQGARMPGLAALPDDLKDLSRRNATELSDLRWKEDVARLVASLEADRGAAEPARRGAPPLRERRYPSRLTAHVGQAGRHRRRALLVVGLRVAVFTGGDGREGVVTAAVPGSSKIPRGEPLKVPSRLDQGVKAVLPVARKWRADAQLTEIEPGFPPRGPPPASTSSTSAFARPPTAPDST